VVEKKVVVEMGCSYFCGESNSSKAQISLWLPDEKNILKGGRKIPIRQKMQLRFQLRFQLWIPPYNSSFSYGFLLVI